MLSVGDTFPDFQLTACLNRNPRIAFSVVSNRSFPNKWTICFFWPKDFTPICATEVRAFADMADDFADRDAVLLGGSVDSEFVHLAWCRQGEGPDELPFLLVSDVKRELSQALGILDAREGVAQRATFIVDPGQTIRHASVNDFSVGRNPKEILRILDALQTDALCPSSWEKGNPTITGPTAFIEEMMASAQPV